MIFLNDVPTWNTRGFRAVGVLTGFLWGHEEPPKMSIFPNMVKGLFQNRPLVMAKIMFALIQAVF